MRNSDQRNRKKQLDSSGVVNLTALELTVLCELLLAAMLAYRLGREQPTFRAQSRSRSQRR